MEWIKEWVLLIAACAIFAELCSMLMPEGQSRKNGLLVLGLVLVFVLVLPMQNILSLLQKMDFSYEAERTQLIGQAEAYTEEEMMAVTQEYKGRLTEYMYQLVTSVEGITDCQVDFIMEENYQLESYGTVKRIYVTAYQGPIEEAATTTPNSGFSQMPPISKIEITLDGIVLRSEESEETEQNVQSQLERAVSVVLQEAFYLEETCVFTEVKDA